MIMLDVEMMRAVIGSMTPECQVAINKMVEQIKAIIASETDDRLSKIAMMSVLLSVGISPRTQPRALIEELVSYVTATSDRIAFARVLQMMEDAMTPVEWTRDYKKAIKLLRRAKNGFVTHLCTDGIPHGSEQDKSITCLACDITNFLYVLT